VLPHNIEIADYYDVTVTLRIMYAGLAGLAAYWCYIWRRCAV